MCFYNECDAEFWSESIVRAKRDYRCEGCSSGIKAGELYSSGRGRVEGHFYVYRTCGACELDRHRIHIAELSVGCRDYESWCDPGDLWELLPEYGIERSSRRNGQRWLEISKRNNGRIAPVEAYRKEPANAD